MSWLRNSRALARALRRAGVAASFLPLPLGLVTARPAAAQGPTAPLGLRTLLESARARHPGIEAARARVRAARGSRTTAGAFANPVVGIQVENAPLPGRPQPPMDRETMATAMLPLEPFYQRGARVHRAAAELRASEADTAAAGQRVVLAALHAYYRTARAQLMADADSDLLAWLDTLVVYNRNRVGEGAASGADLLRAELERDRATAQAALHAAELAGARAALTEFLEVPPAPELRVELPTGPLQLQVEQRTPGELLALLPGVRAARARLDASTAAISIERSLLLREVGVMVGLKQSVGTTSFMGGVSVPFPLVNWNRGEIARAKGERDAAASELAAEERSAAARVSEAMASARILTERTAPLAPALLARAEEARRIALGAYQEGAVPLFSVLDAARAWVETRITYFDALFAQRESVLTLLTLQGVDLLTVLPPEEKGPTR